MPDHDDLLAAVDALPHTYDCRRANREAWEALAGLAPEDRTPGDGAYRCACGTRLEHRLATALRASEQARFEATRPALCSVCGGRPLSSGRACICGDTTRTEWDETQGFRMRCFELEEENAALRARAERAEAALRRVIAHTGRSPMEWRVGLLNGLLDSCARIARAALEARDD